MPNPAPLPTQPKPKQQNPKQHAQQVARQILNEPFEILKNAGQQLSGESIEKQSQPSNSQVSDVPQQSLQEVQALRKKEARHIQAFKTELQEIQRLMQQRDMERRQMRMQEEQVKKKQEQQKQNNPLIEVASKIKKGMLGGMGQLSLKRKQRSAELTKTPSN